MKFETFVEPLVEEGDVVGDRLAIDGATHRARQELAEQSLAVGARVGRDGNQWIAPPVVIAAVLWNLRQRLAGKFRFHDADGIEWQIAEQSLVARWRKFSERAFEFHQFERESRSGVGSVERLAFESVEHGFFVRQLPVVDADAVELVQHHFEFEDSWAVGGRVERRQRSSLRFMDGFHNANFQRQRAITGVERLRDHLQPIAARLGDFIRLNRYVPRQADVDIETLAIEPHKFAQQLGKPSVLLSRFLAGAAKRQFFRGPRRNRGIERQIGGL